jgi:hypothetical protein
MTVGSYILERKKLLKDFDKMTKHARRVVQSRYGEGFTNTVIPETRQEYENLIPQIPYIGKKKPFTQWLLATAHFLTMYRVPKRHGKSLEEIGRIGYEISGQMLDAYPKFLLRLSGRATFFQEASEKCPNSCRRISKAQISRGLCVQIH